MIRQVEPGLGGGSATSHPREHAQAGHPRRHPQRVQQPERARAPFRGERQSSDISAEALGGQHRRQSQGLARTPGRRRRR